eukprot:EG_transcript_11924
MCGQRSGLDRPPGVAEHYIAYQHLKLVLKGKVGPPQLFLACLHGELAKVNAFAEDFAFRLLQQWEAVQELPCKAGMRQRIELCSDLEWFQAYLLINAVALFKVVAAHRRHYPEKEPLNAVGILRSYPFHQSRSFTQKALQSGIMAPCCGLSPLGTAKGGRARHLLCAICGDVFMDPVALGCGSWFCRCCISRVLEAGLPCPGCLRHHAADSDEVAVTKWLANLIQQHHPAVTGQCTPRADVPALQHPQQANGVRRVQPARTPHRRDLTPPVPQE